MNIIAQVLTNETLTPQIILAVLGLAGSLIGAWAYRQKQKAEAEKLKAQAQLKEVEGEAEVNKKQADILDKLITSNTQFSEHLRQVEQSRQKDKQEAEASYRVFTKVTNDNAQAIMERIDIRIKEITAAIHGIPERVGVFNNDGITALIQQFDTLITREVELLRKELMTSLTAVDAPALEDTVEINPINGTEKL